MKWNTNQGHEFEKPFFAIVIIFSEATWCLVTAAYKSVSVQFVFWSLGMAAPKTAATLRRKKRVIFHVRRDLWCLNSCD